MFELRKVQKYEIIVGLCFHCFNIHMFVIMVLRLTWTKDAAGVAIIDPTGRGRTKR